MYRHMHSTSTTSTVQLLETLGRRQSAMSKKQKVVHIHSSICRPVRADCRAKMWGVWVYRGCSHLMKWSRSAVSRLLWISSCPTARGPRWWQLEQAQHTGSESLFLCIIATAHPACEYMSANAFFFCLWVLPAADRSRCLRLPRQAPAVRPRPLVAVPRHAQAPLDREGVADLFTRAVVFGRFLEIGVEQGHVSDSRS